MDFIYYAELDSGNDRWQIVCEELKTKIRSIVGYNLSQEYAHQLAKQLQAASVACQNHTASQ
jgi:hypothetical protein